MYTHSQKTQTDAVQPAAVTKARKQQPTDAGFEVQEPLQLQETSASGMGEQPGLVQKKANNTGLPDQLKTGIENLSGYSMNDVKVHYNSAKPAQLQAHAYAQGTDIHVAPGQEKHLPHEAWHVVQQKQGRVKPTVQLKNRVQVNDDAGLEEEASRMGSKSLAHVVNQAVYQRKEKKEMKDTRYDLQPIVQRKLKTIVDAEAVEQAKTKEEIDAKPLTTVGFEAEFAQMETGPLMGKSHVGVTESNSPQFRFTGLPFRLETDAANALELVTPPFLVETEVDAPIPKVEKIAEITKAMKDDLEVIARKKLTLEAMIGEFPALMGITFKPVAKISVKPSNVSAPVSEDDTKAYEAAELNAIKTKFSEKNGGINVQVNYATSLKNIYAKSQKKQQQGGDTTRDKITGIFEQTQTELAARFPKGQLKDELYYQIIRVVAAQIMVPYMKSLKDLQEKWFQGQETYKKENKQGKFQDTDFYKKAYTEDSLKYLTSMVKDVDNIWTKDNLLSIIRQEASRTDLAIIKSWYDRVQVKEIEVEVPDQEAKPAQQGKKKSKKIVQEKQPVKKEKTSILYMANDIPAPRIDFSKLGYGDSIVKPIYARVQSDWETSRQNIYNTMVTLALLADMELESRDKGRKSELGLLEQESKSQTRNLSKTEKFMSHDDMLMTPRQDTLLDSDKTEMGYWKKKGINLYVMEDRGL